MKHTVLGIEHKVGKFTPTNGKNVGVEQEYDYFVLHSVKKNRENLGGVEVVKVRATPDMYAQLVAECGGKETDVLNRKIDFETAEYYKTVRLKDFEVVE